MSRIILAFLFTAVIASAQAPKLPDSQRRFCEVLDNWQFRGGYAPGAVPKIDPNPIKAAQAPKPPGPGNLFDQLVEVFGSDGTITNWKGKIGFSVYGPIVHLGINPYCPEPAKAGRETWVVLETESAHELPLKSAPAQFLATANSGDMMTFSGHLFYVPADGFYREGTPDSRGVRKVGPELFFVRGHSFIIEVTGIAR